MEKRALAAIVLSFAILLGWMWLTNQLNPPPGPPPGTPRPEAQQAAPVGPPPAEETPAAAEPAPVSTEVIASSKAEEITVDTDFYSIVLTNRGARVMSWRLKAYTDSHGDPLELVPRFSARDDRLPLGLDFDDAALGTAINGALFVAKREPVPAGEGAGPGERISFTWADGKGLEVSKAIVVRKGSYLTRIESRVSDRGRDLPVRVSWGPGFGSEDDAGSAGTFHYTGQVVLNEGGSVGRTPRGKIKQQVVVPDGGRLLWAGLEEQFFAVLFVPTDAKGSVVLRPFDVMPLRPPDAAPDAKGPKPQPQTMVAVGLPSGSTELFVGPKKYTLLRGLGHDLDSVVWFSSYSLIYWFAKYLFLALIWMHDNLVANYGLAIILATVALRALLFPLNQYSMVSMRKMQTQMQRIQPKINAIKAKYKKLKDAESRRKMNEEMMALYRKEGVNPMGGMSGCMPMLIQFPILIAFYNVLTVAVELRGAPFFGWIRDLTLKDPAFVTPLLMGATMFIQQKMTSTKGGDPMQQRMMLMMPVVFTLMFLNLPSGLVLYWFVNNLLGIGQQWLVNRHIGRLEAAVQKA
jgi:YidC/Oxa1 family membrane protein insertase